MDLSNLHIVRSFFIFVCYYPVVTISTHRDAMVSLALLTSWFFYMSAFDVLVLVLSLAHCGDSAVVLKPGTFSCTPYLSSTTPLISLKHPLSWEPS